MVSKARVAVAIAITALTVAACGPSTPVNTSLGPTSAGDPLAGVPVYVGNCAPCHGRDLQGINGLGVGLSPNAYVAEADEQELAAFLAVGREADDPLNMQGIAMPPRGGNPSLTDQDLRDVAAYLKAQQ